MEISKFALKNVNRLIAVGICKNLLCSGVRPLRSKWRPNLRSSSNSALESEVWSNLSLFEFFSGPPSAMWLPDTWKSL